MPDKIVLEEHPGPAHLGAGNLTKLGPAAQLLRVDLEEGRRLLQDKGSHRIHASPSLAWR